MLARLVGRFTRYTFTYCTVQCAWPCCTKPCAKYNCMEALLLSSAVGDGDLLKVYVSLVGGGDVNAAYVGVSPLR